MMQEEQKTKAELVKDLRQLRSCVAELEKAEAALRKSEQQLKDIFENTAVGVYRTTPDGRILMANPALVRMLGFSSFEELNKRNLEEEGFEPSYRRSTFKERIERQGQITGLESQWIRRDGTTLVIIENARLVRDKSGEVLYYEGTAEDITQRKRAEEALRQSEERFRQFFDNEPEYCYMISPEGIILNVNNAALKALGYEKAELVGKSVQTIYAPESLPKMGQLFAKWKESGELKNEEMVITSKNGNRRTVLLSAGAIRDKNGKLLHSVSVQKDITERKQAEQRIRELNEELEQRVRERTAELTKAHEKLLQDIDERRRLEKDILDISEREQRRIGQELHDSLGQQLTGIAIISKVLEQKLKGKSLAEASEAQEIGRLLNQAAEQTRKLAKGLHPVDLDAGGLMSALQELAVTTEQLFGIRCTFDCDEPVPVGDAAVAVHLYRIAQEAVTNAIKHSKAENIVLRLAPDRDILSLTIESDGLGFPEVLPKNKGMGLHIMKYRAEMIDGTLDVHRGAQGGTIVTCAFADQRPDENEKQDYGREKTARQNQHKQK